MSQKRTKLHFEGSAAFRLRVAYCILSGKAIVIKDIRTAISDSRDLRVGLTSYEASFLRLVDKLTNGTEIDINETGSSVAIVPGNIIGNTSIDEIVHDCPVGDYGRSVGWFIEGILPLLPFAKGPVNIRFNGITNDDMDMTVDYIRLVIMPLLALFGCSDGWDLKIHARGFPPLGGGSVSLSAKPVRALTPLTSLSAEGLVRRVRGVAVTAKVSPQTANRMIEASRAPLLTLLPDVHIYSDSNKGATSGKSPGYSILLTAHTTSGCIYAASRTIKDGAGVDVRENLPETLGEDAATSLLNEIARGGCVDSNAQAVLFTFMALTPEDVSRVRIGQLSPGGMVALRLLKEFFGIVFRLVPQVAGTTTVSGKKRSRDKISAADGGDAVGAGAVVDPKTGRVMSAEVEAAQTDNTIMVSCLGIGYTNVAKKVT